jgi:hypothetical protein
MLPGADRRALDGVFGMGFGIFGRHNQGGEMNEQEAKKKAMEILRPVETRLYAAEWRNLMLAIQDELVKAYRDGQRQ